MGTFQYYFSVPQAVLDSLGVSPEGLEQKLKGEISPLMPFKDEMLKEVVIIPPSSLLLADNSYTVVLEVDEASGIKQEIGQTLIYLASALFHSLTLSEGKQKPLSGEVLNSLSQLSYMGYTRKSDRELIKGENKEYLNGFMKNLKHEYSSQLNIPLVGAVTIARSNQYGICITPHREH